MSAPGMSRPTAPMGSARAPLPDRADVVIVGGGVMGLGLAYNLARQARRKGGDGPRIVVIEKGYLVAGASGRNGGGLRMQWGDRDHVRLMMRSIEICRGLTQELGINVWFRQGGYLFLARDDSSEHRLLRNAELHRELGAPTRLIDPAQARRIVPELDPTGVRVASFNPHDGVVFPWPFVWGYAAKAVELGVTVRTHTPVEGIERLGDAADGYRLRLATGETIEADRLVNATGAWSPALNRMLGIDLPNHPHRHEILSSEPLKPFLDPLVVDLASGLYASQSTRGEIVTGITLPDPEGVAAPDGVELGSTLRFFAKIARQLVRLFPVTRGLHPLRQWSGPYDISPDGHAIVGPSPDHPNVIQMCAFTGHGFMMAPAVTELLARSMLGDGEDPILERWDPSRWVKGTSVQAEDMIIG